MMLPLLYYMNEPERIISFEGLMDMDFWFKMSLTVTGKTINYIGQTNIKV